MMELEKKEKVVLAEYRLGLAPAQIMKKYPNLGLSAKQIKSIRQKGLAQNKITNEQIKKAKEKTRDDVLNALRDGLTFAEIIKMYEEKMLSENNIEVIRANALKQGLITDEEIKRGRKKRKNTPKREKIVLESIKQTDIEKAKNILLESIKHRLSMDQIVKRIKAKESDVEELINILIREGILTKKEVRDWKEDVKLLNHLDIGYKVIEIADLEGRTRDNIYKRINSLINKGLTTREKIEEQRRLREEKKVQINEFEKIKREISIDVKIIRKVDFRQEDKIREYIDLCNKLYRDTKIPKEELKFLRNAIQIVPTNENDIIKFVKHCTNIHEYREALNIVRNRHNMSQLSIAKEKEEQIRKLEAQLRNICKLQQVQELINRNAQIYTISEITGLSEEEINILKIKFLEKPVRYLSIAKREKVIQALMLGQKESVVQQKFGISDFEMKDLSEQMMYRKRKIQMEEKQSNIKTSQKEIDLETEIKQDGTTRIVVMFTKLGKTPEIIANALKINKEKVEEIKKEALKYGMLKKDQMEGVKFFEDPDEEYGIAK